jgi:phosphotriesterase-related protein
MKMTTILSVLGPLDTTDLGFTLMHEHIMVAAPGIALDYPELLGMDRYERLVAEMKKIKEGGVDTIVDATTLDLGRDVSILVEASRQSGVHIIACTGWWMDIPRWFNGISADQLAGVFVREIEEGISGSTVKAGILKSASDVGGVKPQEEIVLRGVSRAHLKTGVPIMLHSHSPSEVGREQIAILKEEGVDLTRVKMDHSNDTKNLDYLTWLLDQGCFLGLDRYPGRTVTAEERTQILKALIDKGFADRLCPSHDESIRRIEVANPMITREERLKRNPHGLLYMKKVVIPRLHELGVSENILNGLCVNGPRNFFEAR